MDTNICSAHLRKTTIFTHKFIQYAGRLHLPTIVLGELYAWAYSRDNPSELLKLIENELIEDVKILPFDEFAAFEFGKIRGSFIRQGIIFNFMDLAIASIALANDLTLVTHNTADFVKIPNLRLEDWLT
ncbi:MAG: type II toxin-antitoxin system VapC family toxin [Thermoguttaceae bacterium]